MLMKHDEQWFIISATLERFQFLFVFSNSKKYVKGTTSQKKAPQTLKSKPTWPEFREKDSASDPLLLEIFASLFETMATKFNRL